MLWIHPCEAIAAANPGAGPRRFVWLRAQAGQGFGRPQLALEMALQNLRASNRRRSCPRRRGQGSAANADTGARSMRSASCQESAERALALPLRWTRAEEPVGVRVEADFAGAQRLAASGAVGDVRQQAHQPRHPQREIGQRHPGLGGFRRDGGGLLEDGDQQAEDGLLRIVLGQRLFEHFGKEAENRQAGLVDGRGERRADDFELIEAGQFLPRPLGKPGARQRHRLQRAAEALAALQRRLGHPAELAVVAREKADDQVGLVHRPGAQNDGF